MTGDLLIPLSSDDDARLPAPRPREHDAVSRWVRVAIAVSIALGMFFRLYHLDRKVLWEDEIYGVVHMLGYTEAEIVQSSRNLADAAALQKYFKLPDSREARPKIILDTIHSLASEDPQHPPLYYVLAHLWVERLGSSVAAMRCLSALFGILALPCMYLLCIELFASRTAAWLGVAFVAISPFHVLYAQEVREYSLWTVAVLLMSVTFLRAMRLASVSAWALYSMTFALSLFVFPLSGLVAFGEGAYLVLLGRYRADKVLLGYLVASLAACAPFIPWLLIITRSGYRGMSSIFTTHVSAPWIVVNLLQGVRSTFLDFGPFRYGRLGASTVDLCLTLLVSLFIGYAVVTLVRSRSRSAWPFAVITLCLPMMLLVIHDLFVGGELVSQSRYFTPLYLGIELLFADLFGRTIVGRFAADRTPLIFRFVLVLLFVGAAFSCTVSSQAPTWVTKDFEQNREVAQIVNRSYRPIVVSDFYSSRILGLGYYLAPSVRLKLNVHCDNCNIPPAAHTRLLDEHTAPGEIFLLGPSAQLQREAELWAAADHRRSGIQTIEVKTFPHRTKELKNRLSMFAPV